MYNCSQITWLKTSEDSFCYVVFRYSDDKDVQNKGVMPVIMNLFGEDFYCLFEI